MENQKVPKNLTLIFFNISHSVFFQSFQTYCNNFFSKYIRFAKNFVLVFSQLIQLKIILNYFTIVLFPNL